MLVDNPLNFSTTMCDSTHHGVANSCPSGQIMMQSINSFKKSGGCHSFLVASQQGEFGFVFKQGEPVFGGVLVDRGEAVSYATISVNILLKIESI